MGRKTLKNWENYATVAYDSMKANIENWKNPDLKRPITRIYYDLIFCSGHPNDSGLISADALLAKIKKEKVTKDHCFSPQFIARLIMDHHDYFLSSRETFMKIYFDSCRTITVTPEENTKLRTLTRNTKDGFRILVPTTHKYSHINIELLDAKTKVNNILQVPTIITEYEKQYIITKE